MKLNCGMFEEAKKSTASKNIFFNILIFIVIFVIIQIAESVIPTLLTTPEIMKRVLEDGTADVQQTMKTSIEVGTMPKYMIPTLFCTAFGTIISIIYCRFIEGRYLTSMGMRKKKAVIHYAQGLAVGLVLISVDVGLCALFGISNISLCSSINFGIIALYLLGFLVQGMSEEFIFRGYFMNTLGSRHNTWIAVIVSSCAFSLAHLLNPGFNVLVFLNVALFGVFMGLYMIAFDDIWGACAVHSIWNFTQGNFYGISVSGTGESESVFRTTVKSTSAILTGGDFGIEGSLMTTIVISIAIAIILLKISKNNKSTVDSSVSETYCSTN